MAYSENENTNFYVQATIDYMYEKNIDINGVPLKAAEIEFLFCVASRYGNLKFGSFTTSVLESGENQKVLLRNAIRSLKKRTGDFLLFLEKSKTKILEYYESHCEEIISIGELELQQFKFDSCIIKMGQVPKEVACFKKANQLMIQAFQEQLQRNCEVQVSEIKTLIEREDFSSAYDKLMVLPQNPRCKDALDPLIDAMDQAACEKYILSAEAHFAKGEYGKCVDILCGIGKISKNCQARKLKLEKNMQARLDASARQQWNFKMQKYNDQLKQDVEKARTDHEYALKKLDSDSRLRSKELDVSVELEKYRTQREMEFSKNNAAIEKIRYKEMGRTYRAYFGMVERVLRN